MACSSSNKTSASAFASSVLPTPVGPKKIKEPIGFLSSWSPALLLRTASATASTASLWPMSLWPISSSKLKSFSRSLLSIFDTGIPVHLLITSAISLAVTTSLVNLLSSGSWSNFSFATFNIASFSFKSPYRILATFSKSLSRSAFCASYSNCSICFLIFWIVSTISFSDCQAALIESSFSCALAICSTIILSFFSSFSFLINSLSISNWRSFLSNSSITSGTESSSNLNFAAASSIKSMALSGSFLSEIYLWDNSAAAINASSSMSILW